MLKLADTPSILINPSPSNVKVFIQKRLPYQNTIFVRSPKLWHSSSGRKARSHIGAFLYTLAFRGHVQKSRKNTGW